MESYFGALLQLPCLRGVCELSVTPYLREQATWSRLVSRRQRHQDVFFHMGRLVQRRIALDDLAVLADQKLGEVPIDGLAVQQAGNLLARA